MIIKHFTNSNGKKIIVIDIDKPGIPEELKPITTYVEGGVSEFDKHHVLSLILK